MEIDYKKDQKSNKEIEFEITVPSSEFEKVYKRVLSEVKDSVEMKGFRKGNVPDSVVESNRGNEVVEQTINEVLPEYTVEVLQKETIIPAMPVRYTVSKYAQGADLVFKAVVIIIPEFDLPKLDNLKVKKDSIEIEDGEIEAVEKRLWQTYKGEHKDKTDEWVEEMSKKVGFKSKTLKDLQKELKDALVMQKTSVVEQQYQQNLLSEAIKRSKMEIPEELVEYEAHSREHTFQDQLAAMKTTAEDFCKMKGVTMDQLKKEWESDSREALKNDVFLMEYAKQRKVEVKEDELEAEVAMIRSQNEGKEGVDSGMFDNPDWRSYIGRVMLKRKAFRKFLEETSGNDDKSVDLKDDLKKSFEKEVKVDNK